MGGGKHQHHRDQHNEIAQQHKGPELAEFSVGLIHHETDNGVRDPVPEPGGHHNIGNQHYGKPCHIARIKVHEPHKGQINIGSGIVKYEKQKLPGFRAIILLFHVISPRFLF